MIPRRIAAAVEASRSGFPASLILGPRQSGKTRLVQALYGDLPYVNFESPLERAEVAQDPVGYLARYPGGCVFDEIQNVPELVSYLQVRMDEDRAMGRWALAGSQQFDLRGKVQQSLAGRVAQFELLPLSMEELDGEVRVPTGLYQAVLQGGYPALYDTEREIDRPSVWIENYISTFVNRDVRGILELRESRAFDLFLKRSAGLTGTQVNRTGLAQFCGVDDKTIEAWIRALEIGFLARVVRPYHANFGKRLTKQPRLYFLDTGVACRLMGITTVEQLTVHPLLGSLVETWYHAELAKYFANRQLLESLHFWRTADGSEVDFVLEFGGRLVPIEAKASATASSRLTHGIATLERVAQKHGVEVARGIVIYSGHDVVERAHATFVPWNRIAAELDRLL